MDGCLAVTPAPVLGAKNRRHRRTRVRTLTALEVQRRAALAVVAKEKKELAARPAENVTVAHEWQQDRRPKGWSISTQLLRGLRGREWERGGREGGESKGARRARIA